MNHENGLTSRLAATVARRSDGLKTLSGWRRWLCAFLAGVAAALAMAPSYALPLLFVGFSILVLLLDGAANSAKPKKTAFVTGWFFGFGYFLAGVYWMAFSFFVQADQFAWMAPFAVTGLPAFLALFSGTACAVSVAVWSDRWSRVIAFAGIWAAFEYLRGHILTGLPWNLTGQAFAGFPILAQSAAWYGAYGLSLIAIVAAMLPASTLNRDTDVFRGALAAIITMVVIATIGAVRLAVILPIEGDVAYVRIVQPNIPQREKIDPEFWGRNFYRQLELSKGSAPSQGRVFIIWPENGAPLLNEAQSALNVLTEELPENSVLLAGAVRRERNDNGADRFFNSLMVVPQTPDGRRAVAAYDKHHLVPFGEYLPFFDLLQALGLAQLTPYGDAGFQAGEGPRVLNAGGPSFAPLICYEVIFPGALYPRGERPDWLLTVTNDAWFGDTSGPRQHLDMARLRAIESGLPMARSANTGISALIDAHGRVLERVPLYKEGRIEARLPGKLPRTMYDRLGDWPFFALTAGMIAVGAGFISRWKAEKN